MKKGRMPVFRERLNSLKGSMSVTEFAHKIGLSRQTIGFYLNGDRIPDVQLLLQISQECGVSADYLLGITNEPIPDPTLQAVCEYTGLSGAAVSTLHSYIDQPIQQSFIKRFLDDLLTDSDIATIVTDYLQKYAYAYKLSVSQRLSLPKPKKQDDGLPVFEDGKYQISADDAADLYYGYAVSEAQGHIEAIIRQMAEEMCRPNYIAPPNQEQLRDFRWKVNSEDDE